MPANERPCFKIPHSKEMAFRLKTLCNWLINRLSSDHASNALAQPKHPAKCHLRVSNKKNKICHFFHWILASYGRVGYTKMSFAQVAKGYLSTIANKNSFSLITNMRVASVSTGLRKWPPLVSNSMRVTTKWCPYISAGHKLKIFFCALQFNTCRRTFCKPKHRFSGLFFMDIFQIAKMSKTYKCS